MSVLQAYSSLTSSSPRATISQTLQSIAGAPPINHPSCKALIQLIIDDLQAVIINGSSSRLIKDDALSALSAVKGLGKIPQGAQVLASVPNLKCLITLAIKLESTPDASNEALKCVANTLLLSEPARTTLLSQEIDGGNICIDLLQKSATPENTFLSSRILFLCTASPHQSASFIESIVETKHAHFPRNGTIIDVIALKLDDLISSMQAGIKMSRDAMTDLLKLTFNLLVHYPKLVPSESKYPALESSPDEQKVMGDFWNSRLDGLLPPLVRAFQTIPLSSPNPLTSPLTHIIHSLITIPVDTSSRAIWFGTRPHSHSTTPQPSSPESTTSSLTGSSHDDQSTPKEPKAKQFERAISSVISAGRRSFCRSPRSDLPSTADCVPRAYELLDTTLAYFLPGDIDPDDPAVRDLCKIDGDTSLDEIVCPLVILITRFCLGDDDAKTRIRQWLVPEDLDRTHPLEKRADLLGRCLRLLASVYHSRLKDSMGEMLYAMCDSNATSLAGYFGYGNVAGFLFHKGVVSAPPVSVTSGAPPITASGLPINPITGTIEHPSETIDMTDEEKEREAEKLFVLFDRLEKTGALPPSQNPYRKAFQEGKMG
ncbi:guanine nucleotide exchange factor [Suillus bovinus]|uniref:guanine nucleotide exchange factor n=1 Tax=Suillus bovinus TaxID=48563 RepID=UPI001B86FF86|nr:guanine nucleotide exchange factor [Suillus bovinus]KAG2130462.1 guanine nucleotide exchange factor [Suillus bovinus]